MKKTFTAIATLTLLMYLLNGFAQQTYVPDDNFETALIELGYDSGTLNDSVPTENIMGVVELNISEKGIADLTGIEDFTALEILRVEKNELTDIDLTGNPNLISANLGINALTELDISQNPMLETLVLQHNELTVLDISQNLNLRWLNMYSCKISAMDLSQNINLTSVTLSGNEINEIDVSNLLNLADLSVYTTNLSEIDVSQNLLLANLNVFNTNISEVDVSQNPSLTLLNVWRTEIRELDVTNNPALYYLYASETNLTDVDISSNPLLHHLWVNDNKFQYPELEALFAADTYEQFKGGFKYYPQQWIGERVDTTIEEGFSVAFEMTDYRPGTMDTIRWYRDGELLPGHNSTSLILNDAEPGDAGNYYAIITSGVVPDIELQSNIFRLAVDPSTGIDLTERSQIAVYPNPASDYIYLDGLGGTTHIKIIDQYGHRVKEVHIDEKDRFSLTDCPPGLYFLHIMANDERKVVKKIIWE
jgi:hypothetical protein